MSDKKVITISLSPENVAWIDQNYNNRSGFVDDLVTRAREGDSEMERVIARYQLEQLNGQKATIESRLESINNQIDSVEERFEEIKEEEKETLEQAKEALSRIPNPTVDNKAVQNRADELGMEPKELLEELDL